MIDTAANLASALYFAGVWDAPALMEDGRPRYLSEDDLFDCEHQPGVCDYIYEPEDAEVGIIGGWYCQMHP